MNARREAELAEAASRYIAAGWKPFMLSASKVPLANCDRCKAEHVTAEQMEACACLSCHGFYAATGEHDRARQMIAGHPGGLLAVRTGRPSGLVALDADGPPRPGLETMRRLAADGLLPRTVAARSGGGGYHFLYGHPGGRIRGGADKAGPGVDVKADAGYLIVAPSVHPRTRRPYRWLVPFGAPLTPLPQAWADRLRLRPTSLPSAPWRPPAARPGSYAAAALAGEARTVATSSSGRNDQLNRSAFALARFVTGGILTTDEVTTALMDAAAACGLAGEDGRRACEATIASGLRAGSASARERVIA